MSKYYNDSQIQDLNNKEINIRIKPYRKIINNYILVGQYTKVKRRNSFGKVYYKWIFVWDSEFKRKEKELGFEWKR